MARVLGSPDLVPPCADLAPQCGPIVLRSGSHYFPLGGLSVFDDGGACSRFSSIGSAVATTSGDDISERCLCFPYSSRDLSYLGFNSRNHLLRRRIPSVHGSGGPCTCAYWQLCSMIIMEEKATDGLQVMEFVAGRSWPSLTYIIALAW
jgi:hypothetical protein